MKQVDEEGIERVDGRPVTLYETKFAGAHPLDLEDAIDISTGDLVTFMVTARAEAPKFAYVKKTGEYKRTNTFKMEAVIPLSPDNARKMYDGMNVGVMGVNDGIVEYSYADSADLVDDTDALSLNFDMEDF